MAESRLALLDYRLGDYRGAQERIDNFLRKYPTDKRAGTLLVVQMKILAGGRDEPAEKLRQLTPLYDRDHQGSSDTWLLQFRSGE